jgi:general secretion pathway protein D
VNLGALGQGLNAGLIQGTLTIPGLGTITNLALLARALASDNTANILSTPNLLTLDNEQAKIVVAQNVPFITGQYAQTGSTTTVTPFQTIERKDVGLILTVKPQITEGGSVRLAIYEEVSRVQDTSNPAGIITNKRSLESTVVVDDGQIVVLGGLIQDALTDGTSKVPLAGDVPVVGALFRYDNRQRTKTNLMVFLKPTVVRTGTATTSVTADRYEYLMGEQQRLKPPERPFWPDAGGPELPPLPNPAVRSEPLGGASPGGAPSKP